MPAQAEPLVLVGSGGFGRETAELVKAINASAVGGPRWELRGFLDDDPELAGTTVSGTPVLGGSELIADLPDARVVVCTGNPTNFASKRRIVERLGLESERYATLVHPAAVLAESCSIRHGAVVFAGVVATADVRIGAHAGLMPLCVLTHDDRLGDFVTLASGVRLGGAVRVEQGAYLGAGCCVRENRTIGAGALVGMGAVVTRDVPAGEVWAGIPAGALAGR